MSSVTVKTFELLPYWGWIWLDFRDFKHDYIKNVYRSDICFAGRGPRTADFHGDCVIVIDESILDQVMAWCVQHVQASIYELTHGRFGCNHYSDIIMGTMASQITSLTIVYSTLYSDADQSKHQSSASLAFVRGIHRWPVNSPHKGPVTQKMFPFDDVIMIKLVFFKFISRIDIFNISCEIELKWMSEYLTDELINIGSGNGLVS